MDLNNPQSHHTNYWFVVREDQSSVYTIQNPPLTGQEAARYVVDTGDHRQYIQINEAPVIVPENTTQNADKDVLKPQEEENFWDRDKIKLLLNLCLEERFKNATKDKILWNEIASLVGATPDECSKKYKNLRRTYIRLLKKKRMGRDIKWVHFNICDEVFKECKSLPSSILEPWSDSKVRQLLSLYIENLSKFRSSDFLQKEIWKDIASTLGTTEYNCYHKFKNLKRTYFNWLERSHERGNMIKLQYHQYLQRIFYNYNPYRPWDRTKTSQLVQAYSQIAHKFRNPRYQKKELWKEISTVVGVTPAQCDRKFRNLKQTYLRLKMRANTGKCTSKWRYYKDFETIYNNSSYPSNNVEVAAELTHQYQDDYVEQLLNYYLANKEKFSDPLVRKRNAWKGIASKLGLTAEECDKKFRNLKQTYLRLREKKLASGKSSNWLYYSLFEKIYNEPILLGTGNSHSDEVDQISLSDVKRVLRNMQEKKDKEKFERLVRVLEESNDIHRERNRILQALLNRK